MKKVALASVVALALVGCGGGGGGSATPITIGTAVNGSIGFGTMETTIPGRGSSTYRADLYSVSLTMGQPVTILMCRTGTNSAFDPYVAVHGPGGAMDDVQHDDDSAGSLNSRLVFTPASTGTYTVYATTFSSFSSTSTAGTYQLTVFAGDMSATAQCPTM